MSSRELLALVEELPETSKFKEARDRTYLMPDGERLVDWTKDRYIAGFTAREVAFARFSAGLTTNKPDVSGCYSPLEVWALKQEGVTPSGEVDDDTFNAASDAIERQLHAQS